MLKSVLKMKGIQQLNKNELKTLHGGGPSNCDPTKLCPFAPKCGDDEHVHCCVCVRD